MKNRLIPSISLLGLTGLLAWLGSTTALQAQLVNITPGSSGAIMGTNQSGNYASLGTPYSQFGATSNFLDGNSSSFDTTFTGGQIVSPGTTGGDDSSYVGFNFGGAVSQNLLQLQVNFQFFSDGGWFGAHNNSVPAAGASLAPYLVDPTLQITTDGVTWQDVSDVSTYLAVAGLATGQNSGASVETGTVTFTMADPISGIEGIRIIGLNGGYAGGDGGFVGVNEERVFGESLAVPEPSDYALIGLGVLFLGAWGLRRKRMA